MPKVRDPIHGFISFDEKEKQIINSLHFQRLRNIKQLALTSLVYPGAMHSRFEHSLGVMDVAGRMFDSVKLKPKNRIEKEFKKADISLDEARAVLRLAALYHDMGHLPFSHGAESALPNGIKHEHIGLRLIENDKEKLDKMYFNGASDIACALIGDDKYPIKNEFQVLKDIISGSIDADRSDYLLRDSYHCGVDYGRFDHKRLIESLTTSEYDGKLNLSIDSDGTHALEALILARYYMFTQVYYHKTRRIYDYYLTKYMSVFKEEFSTDLLAVLNYDDISVATKMRESLKCPECPEYEFAYRIINRINHSSIYETSEFCSAADKRNSKIISEKLAKKYQGKFSFWMDANDGVNSIHKFYRDEDFEESGKLFYVCRGEERHILTSYSRFILV